MIDFTAEIVGKNFGHCNGCQVIRFKVRDAAPVEKHVCWAVRLAWPVEVERRRTARQDVNVYTEEERYWSGEVQS